MLNKFLTNKFLTVLGQIENGSLTIETPDGRNHEIQAKNKFRHDHKHAHIYIYDWRTIQTFAAKGDIGLAESYRDGWWDTDDLCTLLLIGLENEHLLTQYIRGGSLANLIASLLYKMRENTLEGSKKNIQAHYDLGNDFYKLWLDPSMTYSAALYQDEKETLLKAQDNKYDRILDRFDKDSGSLLEVGCGWGGFAHRAIARSDKNYDIKGITLSKEQHKYAQNRVNGSADIVLEDYRDQQGKYNYITSIEMFEAVGEKFWPTYFSKLKSLMDQKGKAMIQTITIDEKHFDRYRKGGDMIRTFIFPGGMLPSPTRFHHEAQKSDMRVTDQFAFGQDYAKTCKIWFEDFSKNEHGVRKLGFGTEFIRLWQFYLAACYAAFSVERINVMHMEVQHA